MIDIGVNLLHPQLAADRDAVIARARAAGVTQMLVTATDLDTAAAAIALCEETDLYCTAGVHPHHAAAAPENLTDRLTELAGSCRVKAIGETGLDFFRNFSPPDVQRHVFHTQLEAARRIGLPVFVHDRDSDGAVFEALRGMADALPGVVVHCFTSDARDLERYLTLGCYIGITGWITEKKRGAGLARAVTGLPLDRLLIETDAPFLRPHNVPADWHTRHAPGASRRRNEPALLPWVARGVAEAMGVPVEEVIAHSTANARKLFGLP